jgi:hypothetical protein
MLWAGIGFSCYASSHLHYFRGRPFSSLHAWLRARAGALANKNIELFSHLNPGVSFQSSSHIIDIRRASKRTFKMSNRYLAIQRDRFPNKFHQRLQCMRFSKSCIAMLFSMSDITVLRISIYASSALTNFGGLPLSCSHARLRACVGALATKKFLLRSHECLAVSFQTSPHIIEIRIA